MDRLKEVSQKEKGKYHMISLISSQMNLSTKQKQTHRYREQTVVAQGEWEWGRDGVGVWNQQIQASICRMDTQQGPPVQHRELYTVSCDKP